MAGETIRDVIIKIRLQQTGPTKLQAPDTSAFDNAIKSTTKTAVDAFTTEEKEAIRAYSRIMKEREKAARDAQKLAENTAKYAEGIDPTGGRVIGNTAARNEAERQRAQQAELGGLKQRIEAYSAIGEGAIRAARGVAFLTAANEEDLQVAIQYVAAAQGVLDTFAGTANVLKAVISLKQASTVATGAAAAAETGYAAAAGSAATAQTGLNVAMLANPITAGIALAIGAGAVAWKSYADAQREAAEVEKRYTDALSSRIQREREAAQSQIAAAETRINGLLDLSGQRTDAQERRRLLDQAAAQAAIIRNQAPGGVSIDDVTRQAQLDAEVKGNEQLLRIQQERVNASRDIISGLERERDVAAQQLDIAKRTVEAEKERLQSAEEKFGRLSTSDQERLKDIAKRRQAGEKLTEQEARFLDQTGLGGNAANQFFRERGQQAGFGDVAAGFGLDQALEQAKRDLKTAQATFGETLNSASEDLAEEFRGLTRELKTLQKLTQSLTEGRVELDRLNREIEKLKHQEQDKSLHGK